MGITSFPDLNWFERARKLELAKGNASSSQHSAPGSIHNSEAWQQYKALKTSPWEV